jgi:mono/diheme cytochrome c family protein
MGRSTLLKKGRDLRRGGAVVKQVIGWLLFVAIVIVVAGGLFVYSGWYDIGADQPHLAPVRWLLGTVRDRAIETRSEHIAVPALGDPRQMAEGAEHYAEMCAGCHLAPGVRDSEIRQGLNPPAPDLTRSAPEAAEAFWTIKHGIKMTGMPAWGPTHSDDKLWAIVAFVEALPHMSAKEYEAWTHRAHEDRAPPGSKDPGRETRESTDGDGR